MSWLTAHWRAVTATVAVLGTLGAVASVGAEVQTKLSELEATAAIAEENTKTVGKLVELHEEEAIRAEYEQKLRDLMDVIAELQARVAEQEIHE